MDCSRFTWSAFRLSTSRVRDPQASPRRHHAMNLYQGIEEPTQPGLTLNCVSNTSQAWQENAAQSKYVLYMGNADVHHTDGGSNIQESLPHLSAMWSRVNFCSCRYSTVWTATKPPLKANRFSRPAGSGLGCVPGENTSRFRWSAPSPVRPVPLLDQ